MHHVVAQVLDEPVPERRRVGELPVRVRPLDHRPVPALLRGDVVRRQQRRLRFAEQRARDELVRRGRTGQAADQRLVVDRADLAVDQRPDPVAEPQRALRPCPGTQLGDDRLGQEPREMAAVRAFLVLTACVVRHAAPGSGVQQRFPARRVVDQAGGTFGEPPAAAGGQQREVVEEAQAQAADQHGHARRERVEVGVGGARRADVAQTVPDGEVRVRHLGVRRLQRTVAECQHDAVEPGQPAAVGQRDLLARAVGAALVGVVERDGLRAVHPDREVLRRGRHQPVDDPFEVVAVEATGRVVVRPEPGRLGAAHLRVVAVDLTRAQHPCPLVQARAGHDRTGARHALVGEQAHL